MRSGLLDFCINFGVITLAVLAGTFFGELMRHWRKK